MHDVPWPCDMNCVRSKDVHKQLARTFLSLFFIVSEKGKLFGMGDNSENQLGINQRGRSEEPVLQVVLPTRIHLSGHSKASKPVQVSCGAFHTAVVTGQSNE